MAEQGSARESRAHNVIITGATSGIGRALALAGAERGYRMLLIGRRAWDGPELAGAHHAQVDVREPEALRAAISDFEHQCGATTLLVNNAGIMPLGAIHSQDPSEWHAAFEVNALPMLHASQAVLPRMMEARTGTIVTISSIAGRNVYANHTAYSGTKFAVHAMMESMRREYARYGIRFITVAPGVVDTDLLTSVSDPSIVESYTAMKERLDRGLSPSDVAESVLHAYELPQSVCVRELVIAPTSQES